MIVAHKQNGKFFLTSTIHEQVTLTGIIERPNLSLYQSEGYIDSNGGERTGTMKLYSQ